MNTVHARLEYARRRNGYLSATEAAVALGVRPSTYLGHEGGSRGIRPDTIRRYATAFGCSPGWLAFGEGQPPRARAAAEAASQ